MTEIMVWIKENIIFVCFILSILINITLEAVVKFIERMEKKDTKLHNYLCLYKE